jgi:urea transport system permease protein
VEVSFTIMMIFLARAALVLGILGLFLFSGPSWTSAADGPGSAPPTPFLEQALAQITSEDESVREAAIRVLIEQGDDSLVPRLEAIRTNASRNIRQAIKPLMDLLKNRAKLASPSSDVRRSAATDLGSAGNPSAIPWLDAAAVNEPNKWVRYTMEESAALLKLASGDPSIKAAAAEKLGELRSQNGVPVLKQLVEAGAAAKATDAQKTVAKAADTAIDRKGQWWCSARVMS